MLGAPALSCPLAIAIGAQWSTYQFWCGCGQQHLRHLHANQAPERRDSWVDAHLSQRSIRSCWRAFNASHAFDRLADLFLRNALDQVVALGAWIFEYSESQTDKAHWICDYRDMQVRTDTHSSPHKTLLINNDPTRRSSGQSVTRKERHIFNHQISIQHKSTNNAGQVV